jgi:uncharacterized protein (TIGR04255 family)
MSYPNLRNAPIIEGLIQIQVKPHQGINIEDVRAFAERVKEKYLIVGELRDLRAQFVFNQSEATSQPVAAMHVGYRMERNAPHFVVHARTGELLVSRLKPYDRWEELLSETQYLWSTYVEVCKPELVTRLATRFINQLPLPLKDLDLDHYLSAPALIPHKLPQVFEQFLTRVVVPDSETGIHIAISQASGEVNSQSETLPILLDIDVYKAELEFEVASDKIWDMLGKMRDIKNRAFFGSVTEKAIKLFS